MGIGRLGQYLVFNTVLYSDGLVVEDMRICNQFRLLHKGRQK
jgi:hypothetical protein